MSTEGKKECLILTSSQALLVEALQTTQDETGAPRKAGEQWYIYGPRSYCTPAEIAIRQQLNSVLSLDYIGFYLFRPGPMIFIWLLLVLRWLFRVVMGLFF